MYSKEEQKIDDLLDKLNISMKTRIEKEQPKIKNLQEKLITTIKHKIEKEENKINNIKIKLDLLNPDNVLKKGYSITLINGKIAKSIKELNKGDTITTKLSDGQVISEIK